jgi:hypothetical protein
MYKESTRNAFWGTRDVVRSHSYYETEMWEQLKMSVAETSPLRTARDFLISKVRLGCICLQHLFLLPDYYTQFFRIVKCKSLLPTMYKLVCVICLMIHSD